MTKHRAVDDGDPRKYYASLPNLIFDLGLNPFELALYAHFKRSAGDSGGVCWKSRATIAKESGMSAGMVTKARIALECPRSELGNLPLITVQDEPSKTGGKSTCKVRITDVWLLNMSKYSTSRGDGATSPRDVEDGAPSPHDERRHTVTLPPSPRDHKEELFKKNTEEGNGFLSKLRTDPLYSHVDFDSEIERMRRWLARSENKNRRFTERFVLRWIEKVDRPVALPSENGSEPKKDRVAWEAEQRRLKGWDRIPA